MSHIFEQFCPLPPAVWGQQGLSIRHWLWLTCDNKRLASEFWSSCSTQLHEAVARSMCRRHGYRANACLFWVVSIPIRPSKKLSLYRELEAIPHVTLFFNQRNVFFLNKAHGQTLDKYGTYINSHFFPRPELNILYSPWHRIVFVLFRNELKFV